MPISTVDVPGRTGPQKIATPHGSCLRGSRTVSRLADDAFDAMVIDAGQ